MALNIIRKSMILIPFYPNICYHKNNETFPIENIMPSPKRLFEKYYMKPIISKNLTPLPPFPTREWGF
jgi:hypothetical protein